jgi:hypothetical protein
MGVEWKMYLNAFEVEGYLDLNLAQLNKCYGMPNNPSG